MTYSSANGIDRGRIVRYHRRDELLQVLSELEQQRHRVLQLLQQEQQPSPPATERSSLASRTMSDSIYVVSDRIEPATTRAVIEGLGGMLHHVPFTVVGRAALVHHGRERRVARITLACPEDCVRAVHGWARTHGMHSGSGLGDSFGYRAADGSVCRVRVRALYREPFNRIRTTSAKVMTLPNMVNEYAGLYAAGVRRFAGRDEGLIAGDILWMLRRIAALTREGGGGSSDQAFTSDEVTWIRTRAFWEPFIHKHPEAVDLFRAAGAFRCFGERAGGHCVGCLDKARPRPASVFDSRPRAGLGHLWNDFPELQGWNHRDTLPPLMPYLQPSSARTVSIREPASAASSRAASPVSDITTTISTEERPSMATSVSAIDVEQIGRVTVRCEKCMR